MATTTTASKTVTTLRQFDEVRIFLDVAPPEGCSGDVREFELQGVFSERRFLNGEQIAEASTRVVKLTKAETCALPSSASYMSMEWIY